MAKPSNFYLPLALVLAMICSCQATTFLSEMNGTNVNIANAYVHQNQQCLQCDKLSLAELDKCGCGSSIDKMTAALYMTGLANGSYVMFYTLNASMLDPTDNITKAHIHPGAAQNISGKHTVVFFETPEAFDAQAFKIAKTFSNTTSVGPDEYKGLLLNPPNYYMNVHTVKFSVGAIRGQLVEKRQPPLKVLDLPVSDGTFHSQFATGPILGNGQISFGTLSTLGVSLMAIGFTEGEKFTSLTVQKGASGMVGPTVLDLSSAIDGSDLIETGFSYKTNYTVPPAYVAAVQDIIKTPSNYYLQLNTNKNSVKGQPLLSGNAKTSAASRTKSIMSSKTVLTIWVVAAVMAASWL